MNHKKYFFATALLLSLISFGQQNIMIDNVNFPTEPSIAINPNNTNQLVAGSNIDNVYKSNDSGLTWAKSTLTSTYGVWGDPVIMADNNNNFYFFHLSNPASSGNWVDRIVCQKSIDGGNSWNNGSYTGLNGTKVQDKHWTVFDKINNIIYVTWTQFDEYGTTNPFKKSIIQFSKSTNFGATWTPALKINNIDGSCIDNSTTVEGAVPTLGPNGEIYVSWSGPNGLVFKKSTDQGTTWSANEIAILPSHQWDFTIPGLDRCNGMPITSCDTSPSAYNGTIYVNWADQSNGVDDTDIFISKSTNGGSTWTTPLRVNNDPPGKQQFLTWMTIDQTNGYIYIVFYDRRNYSNNSTDVYLAYSTNGGNTFTNTKISNTSFLPVSSEFFGDYTNIVAHNGIVRPIWGRMDNGETSIWTAIITHNGLSTPETIKDTNEESIINYPNPSIEETFISFKLYKESNITITIYDPNGKEVLKVIENKSYPFGKHVISFDNNLLNPGNYIYTIESSYFKKSKKLIIE